MRVKPATMLIALRENDIQLPTVIQLNNYLKRLGSKKDGTGNHGTITLDNLIKFYEENREVTEDEDKMFVVDCYCQATFLYTKYNTKYF